MHSQFPEASGVRSLRVALIISYSSNGSSLSFEGQPGPEYVVEQTSDPTSPIAWQAVTYIYPSGNTNTIQVLDTTATNTARFYRVRTL
jgi:hypothetical protein